MTGESAGGGLAARLALYNRDFGNVPICGQALTYPKLDCSTATDKQPIVDPYAGEYVWTRAHELIGEEALQGGQTIPEDKIQYMSPSLAKDLSNLPPAFIIGDSLDLFCIKDITYAQRLICAGVNVELHVFPVSLTPLMQYCPTRHRRNCIISSVTMPSYECSKVSTEHSDL